MNLREVVLRCVKWVSLWKSLNGTLNSEVFKEAQSIFPSIRETRYENTSFFMNFGPEFLKNIQYLEIRTLSWQWTFDYQVRFFREEY